MAYYSISRASLKERLLKIGSSEKESVLLVKAIFSYLHSINALQTGISIGEIALQLNAYDFRFLYGLYFSDSMAKGFLVAFRDSTDSVIEFSTDGAQADRSIRDYTGLGDKKEGLYFFIINYDKVAFSSTDGNEQVYNIINPTESLQPLVSGSSAGVLFSGSRIKEDIQPKRSYTDSVMDVSRKLQQSSTNDADFNKIKEEDVPFLNGTPGTAKKSDGKKESLTYRASDIVPKDYKKGSQSSDLKVEPDGRYPVLDFILKRNK